jgi:hypothetical protein
MKIFQLLITPSHEDMDYQDLIDMVDVPNPVFAHLQDALTFAEKDAQNVAAEFEEEAEIEADLPERLEWRVSEDCDLAYPVYTATSDRAGMCYAIHTMELN